MRPHDVTSEVAHCPSCHNAILEVRRHPTYRKCVHTMPFHKYGKFKLYHLYTTLQLKNGIVWKQSDEL